MVSTTPSPKFPRAFWVANYVELLERVAFHGVFIVLTLYLSRILGFTDVEAAWLAGAFAAGLYFLPTFSGALADKVGFKTSLLSAFALLTFGYGALAMLPGLLEAQGVVEYGRKTRFFGIQDSNLRWSIVPILIILMLGGSIVRAAVTATVAKTTTLCNRARGFSIFYMMLNIGAFSGQSLVRPMRELMGEMVFINLNYFAATMSTLAFLAILLFYKCTHDPDQSKSLPEVWQALRKVLTNGRLLVLLLIVSGFWMVQHQLYATMPKYVLRMAGEGASPSWYANVNPVVVFLGVNFVTTIMRKQTALVSMTTGMFIMPISALIMASGNLIDGGVNLGVITMHPIAFMMVIGFVLQGLAECFITPRFLEYFSLQAPKGEEGLYLGASHMHSFFSSLLAFGLSGYLLEAYCPDPRQFETHQAWQAASANAHYIWYIFAAIATTAAIAMVVYGRTIKRLDRHAAQQGDSKSDKVALDP